MAKERLSKLQKWILAESYKWNILHDTNALGQEKSHYYRDYTQGYMSAIGKKLIYQYFECWIYENYYGFHSRHGSGISTRPAYKKAHVTVHRAVKNMEQKGLIDVNHYLSYQMRNWRITAKGIAALKKVSPELFVEVT